MQAEVVLSEDEIRQILHYFKRKRYKPSLSVQLNLIVFRLSCCCGLRGMELIGLKLKDVIVGGSRPLIHIRKDNTKGEQGKRRGRMVSLSWDKGTLDDLTAWKQLREAEGAAPEDYFLVSHGYRQAGAPLTTLAAQRRWRRVIKRVLGEERARYTGIHKGRHTFCTHALYKGRSLQAVQMAAGHRSTHTTALYLHAVEALERKGLPDVFGD